MTVNNPDADSRTRHEDPPHGRFGHGWMMIACCIPMLLIAAGLAVAGVLSAGFLFFAIACTAMMAVMMRGMSNGDGHGH